MREAVAHLVLLWRAIGQHDEVGSRHLFEQVDVGYIHLWAIEIDGAEVIPIRDAAEDSLEWRVIEDVPIERVADGDEPGFHGGGVVHDGGLGVIVRLSFQRAHEVQPFFEVVVRLFGLDVFLPNLEIQYVDVA